jgi:predicted dehydrogenase
MRKPLNLGVVGCGYWGPNLLRNFRALPDCRLRTVCDLSERRLMQLRDLYPEIEGETRFERLLDGADLDAVAIATPAHRHFAMAKATLLAGKHTLVEKPLAVSAAEAAELVALAERHGLVLMVGHTCLYSPAVRRIKEMVEGGDLGELRHICARRLSLGLFRSDINVAWDLASHDLSVILHLMAARPLSVSCCGTAHVTPGLEDVTAMSLRFAAGRSALIHSSWLEPRKVREMTIVGSERMLVYDAAAPREKIRIFDTQVVRRPGDDGGPGSCYGYRAGAVSTPALEEDEPLRAECRDFLDCILGHTAPIASGPEGLEVVRILEASSRSLRANGGAVTLTPPLMSRPPAAAYAT